VKTGLQVAAIIGLIAFEPTPVGVDVLVYAAVAMTVISGADYFLGLRRYLEESPEAEDGVKPSPKPGGVSEPA
jgi:CDP-diacylglycerol--glycerol-3-phosphate 3-phosphatidyltransferase